MNYTSQILQNIDNGEKSGIISFNEDKSRITYHCNRNYKTSFKNPEEKVRASYFVELVHTYQYPQKKIDIEITVPRRTPEDRADIVVYSDDECKESFLVVECKKEGITDAEFKQAIEQAFGNANSIRSKYASVVAGNTKTAFNISGFKPNERERNVIADIPIKYGKAPKFKFIKGDKSKDLKVVSREDLISALEKCHDTVWQGGKLAPTTAFDEVSKLLFCKMKDEKDGTKRNDPYRFQIGTHETAEEVAERIDEIYQEAKKQDEEVFKEDIKLESKVLYSVVEHLQGLALNKTDLDTKGVAFEKFMIDYFKGKMGQFFTPRPVIDFAVKLLEPNNTDLVIDPSCGSGGFLLSVLDTVRKDSERDYDEVEADKIWHKFAEKNLYGIEINDQIARICKMNMIIHDDGHTNVISTDSLRFLKDIKKLHGGFKPNHFDLLLANPPFGAIVKSTEKEEKYLDQYQLGENRKNQKTEILFIERCIDFLKEGTGRMGLVLPDGILTNSSLSYVRDLLLERCQIIGIVSLPQFAFSHFGAGVKSSLVFARKKEKNEVLNDYPIFMAIADKIGYDATGRESENELPEILQKYFAYTSGMQDWENHQIFSVTKSSLEDRIDPHFYLPSFKDLIDKIRSKPYVPLGELVEFSSETWNQKDIFDKEFPYIEISEIELSSGTISNISYILIDDAPSRARMIVRENDIIVSTTRPHRGAIAFIDKEKDGFIASTGFVILRRLKTNKISKEYLFYILRTKICLQQMLQRSSGGNYPAITASELKNIFIPVPPLDKQSEIINTMSDSISKYQELLNDAGKVLESGNITIETKIFE
ncbi:N-6 DNA methylase [Cyclobacterium salsum]|uniref:N-6 DNA methylase n=1 Tax=Cyclobacterium salsum TaxID=2666329 RepID=UPI0013917D5D|nr:N-6 DNA methylase [Cyclobacterium salsum]